MKRLLNTGFWLLSCLVYGVMPVMAQRSPVPVFTGGEDGYQTYRIPAIIGLKDGTLLAFAEGRVGGMADFGHIDIVMKMSRDHGASWGKLQVVADNGTLQAGNPAPVVDYTDPAFPGGRIFLFYNTGDATETQVREGKGTRRVWFRTSTDQGRIWSAARDITRQVKRPGWRAYANTPGHAMQFSSGPYRGRIYVAANHSSGDPEPRVGDYRANGYYPDDHGKTFSVSDDVPFPGGNEATAAQCSPSGLVMNIRNQQRPPARRIVAFSGDGGMKWDTVYYDQALTDPVCEGSILGVGRGKKGFILAFCNNADTVSRNHLTVRISPDGARHWTAAFPVRADTTGTGYADLVAVGRRRRGILYERDDYKQIAFVTLDWSLRAPAEKMSPERGGARDF
jgi:sialidase-1